jgi:copper transport protein
LIDFGYLDCRRSFRVAAIFLGLVICSAVAQAATRALLHATLLRSTPSANSHLSKSPDVIRLVFSEQVVPDLSQISIVRPDGSSIQLQVANDPHNVRMLIGRVTTALTSGSYKISWRVLSADGHPVGGTFSFSLEPAAENANTGTMSPASTTPQALPSTAKVDSASRVQGGLEQKPVPIMASLFRGVGLGALMTGVGLLFFGLTSRQHRNLVPKSLIVGSIAIGAILLIAHLIAWLEDISPNGTLSTHLISSVIASTVGRVELLRTGLAILTLWAVALARHRTLALVLGVTTVVVSGSIGHPAAIDPYWTIPAKAVHLLGATVWLGGLVWLVWLARCDDEACRIEAKRVSSIALLAVIMIALSGVLQTVLFLNTLRDLIDTNYGRLILAKIFGLLILIGFGAYNRFGLLPQLDTTDGTRKLSRSVRQEIAVVAVVIVIGGFLAYVPTPPVPLSASTATTGVSQ